MAIIIGSEEGKDEKCKHPSYKMANGGGRKYIAPFHEVLIQLRWAIQISANFCAVNMHTI